MHRASRQTHRKGLAASAATGQPSWGSPVCSRLEGGSREQGPPPLPAHLERARDSGLPAGPVAHFRRGQRHRPHSTTFLEQFRCMFHPRPAETWTLAILVILCGGRGSGAWSCWPRNLDAWGDPSKRKDGPLARRQQVRLWPWVFAQQARLRVTNFITRDN